MSRPNAPDAAPAPGARRPVPRRAAALACGAAAVAVAVAVPLALAEHRSSTAQEDLRADLQRVATAQAAWRDAHGTYSTSLPDLRVPAPRTDVAIVSAGPDAFCAGAYDATTRTALFFSPAGGFGPTACR